MWNLLIPNLLIQIRRDVSSVAIRRLHHRGSRPVSVSWFVFLSPCHCWLWVYTWSVTRPCQSASWWVASPCCHSFGAMWPYLQVHPPLPLFSFLAEWVSRVWPPRCALPAAWSHKWALGGLWRTSVVVLTSMEWPVPYRGATPTYPHTITNRVNCCSIMQSQSLLTFPSCFYKEIINMDQFIEGSPSF